MPYYKYQQQLHEVRDLGQGQAEVDGETLAVALSPIDACGWLLRRQQAQKPVYVHQSGDKYQIWYGGEYYELSRQSRASGADEAEHSDRISAPLTGKVIVVSVTPGQAVAQGAPLVVLESMKMETALSAPLDALVKAVHCAPGDQVGNGQLLIELELKSA